MEQMYTLDEIVKELLKDFDHQLYVKIEDRPELATLVDAIMTAGAQYPSEVHDFDGMIEFLVADKEEFPHLGIHGKTLCGWRNRPSERCITLDQIAFLPVVDLDEAAMLLF